MKVFDTIVIGNGPAGISAAIYLKRFGRDVLVIGKDLGALEKAELIENYYSLEPMSGKEIVMSGIKQATKLGVLINHDEVIAIDYLADGFNITAKKGTYQCKTIFIATGKARNSFPLAKKYDGKGISYCATCDGFFYKNKNIAIVGYNEYMKHELEALLPLASTITVYTNGNQLEVKLPENVNLNEEPIVELIGSDRFEGIRTESETRMFDGCFIALGSANAFTLAKHLGLEIKENNLVVDNNYMTNIPGIFAGGDVIGGVLQIIKAASDGAQAGYSINKWLRDN